MTAFESAPTPRDDVDAAAAELLALQHTDHPLPGWDVTCPVCRLTPAEAFRLGYRAAQDGRAEGLSPVCGCERGMGHMDRDCHSYGLCHVQSAERAARSAAGPGANPRRLAWFTDDELVAELERRAPDNGGAAAALRRVEALADEWAGHPWRNAAVFVPGTCAGRIRAALAPQAGDGARSTQELRDDEWWLRLFLAAQAAVDEVPYAAASEYPLPHAEAFRSAVEPFLAARQAGHGAR